MSTWVERVKALLGDEGYQPGMRRSFQTIILYEAKRGMEPRLKAMRPFQRKAAFMNQCYFLIDQLSGIMWPGQRNEIMYRTMKSRVPINGDCAWIRLKNIAKELKKLEQAVKPFLAKNRTHKEAVDLMVQKMYSEIKKDPKSPAEAPSSWEHSHNHVIMTFRLYYNGSEFDRTFPSPVVDPNLHVPSDLGKAVPTRVIVGHEFPTARTAASRVDAEMPMVAPKPPPGHHDDADDLDVAAILRSDDDAGNERRRLLHEVRQHLDLLKDFEGVVPENEIAKRKRELFLSLPAAPASASKRNKP